MGGVLELADAPRSGRPRQADAAYLHALEAAVSADPGALGQACDVWTSARLSAYSAKTAGTRIAPGWVRVLKRDHYSHLAPTLRSFVDELPAGPRRLGAVRCDIVDEVPDWWLAGHRREPMGRPAGHPHGAKHTAPHKPHLTNLPATTWSCQTDLMEVSSSIASRFDGCEFSSPREGRVPPRPP